MDAKVYERALDRAHKEALAVTLLETWGAHVSHPDRDGYYTVRFQGNTTTCNCEAGVRGTYCKHRAIVHETRQAKATAAKAMKQVLDTTRLTDGNWRESYAQAVLMDLRAR